jgi:E3 ubiquitin-protein ligase NEDD4
VNEDSILAVQVFDQKKFKKKDQGFLGVINIRIGDIIELATDADGVLASPHAREAYRIFAC